METAEHREPCESRGSRTVLGAPGGEIPPGNQQDAEENDQKAVLFDDGTDVLHLSPFPPNSASSAVATPKNPMDAVHDHRARWRAGWARSAVRRPSHPPTTLDVLLAPLVDPAQLQPDPREFGRHEIQIGTGSVGRHRGEARGLLRVEHRAMPVGLVLGAHVDDVVAKLLTSSMRLMRELSMRWPVIRSIWPSTYCSVSGTARAAVATGSAACYGGRSGATAAPWRDVARAYSLVILIDGSRKSLV